MISSKIACLKKKKKSVTKVGTIFRVSFYILGWSQTIRMSLDLFSDSISGMYFFFLH